MMTPKRRLSTLIFACLCFKKSFLIKILILYRVENQEILSSTVIQCQTVKVKLFSSLSDICQAISKKIFYYYRLIVFYFTSHSCPPQLKLVSRSRKSLSIGNQQKLLHSGFRNTSPRLTCSKFRNWFESPFSGPQTGTAQ